MGVEDTLLFTERLLKAALTPALPKRRTARREREPTEVFFSSYADLKCQVELKI